MRTKLVLAMTGALVAISAFGATTSASAATEFGDNCVGNELTESEPITFFQLTSLGNPLSNTAPVAGVITKWKVNLVPAPVSFPQTLRVLRQNGPKTVQTIGEATQTITGGLNSANTRIPVQAGDRLGLLGAPGVGNLYCQLPGGGNNSIGAILPGGGATGTTSEFVQIEAEARFPVSAVIEPDADNDGFGDETQDQCPQSATSQTACPVITLSASSIVKKGLVTVLVTSSSQAPVSVLGAAKLGKGKSAKLRGGTQVVAPGAIARFTLLFPKKLKTKLKELSPKQSLKAKLTVSATNVAGQISTKVLNVKLKGQAKPSPKAAHKHKGQA
jgi:hypothetical protein